MQVEMELMQVEMEVEGESPITELEEVEGEVSEDLLKESESEVEHIRSHDKLESGEPLSKRSRLTREGRQVSDSDFFETLHIGSLSKNIRHVFFFSCWYDDLGG